MTHHTSFNVSSHLLTSTLPTHLDLRPLLHSHTDKHPGGDVTHTEKYPGGDGSNEPMSAEPEGGYVVAVLDSDVERRGVRLRHV